MNSIIFIVSNFNYDCSALLKYLAGYEYIVYDQSTDKHFVKNIWNQNFVNSPHSGHNISDYYSYFYNNYSSLPEFIGLIKGNIFPRHLSESFFKKAYTHKFYTFLFEQQGDIGYPQAGLFQGSQYYEYVNNWYVKNHPHWFFQSIHELYYFIYGKKFVDLFVLYSPGACYILHKEQIQKHPKEFFHNINSIITYTNPVNPFPSEAHQVERLSHIIYSSINTPLPYLSNNEEFQKQLYANSVSKKYTQHALAKITNCDPPLHAVQTISHSAVNYITRVLGRVSSRELLPRVLVSGCHSWEEVNRWQSLPNSGLCITSILELYGSNQLSLEANQPHFLKMPMAEIINHLSAQPKYDLYVYEGYHLENEILNIRAVATSILNYNAHLLVFDVLGNPFPLLWKLCFHQKPSNVTVSNIIILPVLYRGRTEYAFHLRISNNPLMAAIRNLYFMCICGIHWLFIKSIFAIHIFFGTKMILRP